MGNFIGELYITLVWRALCPLKLVYLKNFRLLYKCITSAMNCNSIMAFPSSVNLYNKPLNLGVELATF